MIQQDHAAHGVQFRLSSEVRRMVGTAGHVSAVELKSGELLPADFVVVGVGVRPATDFLIDSGLALDPKDQSVRVNALLQSSDPDIYAAGDIARWGGATGTGQRIEHWRTAQQQGIVAARNMLGRAEDVNHHVPFFWTAQWGINLRYVGHATAWDEIIYREGRPEQKAFLALYVKDGKLRAAAGCQHDAQMDALEFVLRDDMPLSLAQMRDDSLNLVAYVGGAYARR
jgi:NADPH-dependent 2,4-dienoyl-CoA reductase/sulfur reductase-like enzyme